MTVAELIAALQAFPSDAQVVIEDADTSWALAASEPTSGEGSWSRLVVLAASYSDKVPGL